MGEEKTKGLTLVFTGDGKGKTTAALGMALRAWGQGLKVLVLQFVKGGWRYGELMAAEKLDDNYQIKQLGVGFVGDAQDDQWQAHQKAAQEALAASLEAVQKGEHHLIILDEINFALARELIDVEQVLEMIRNKPEKLHLVLTGRGAPEAVIELADLVTEMKPIKHPFDQGVPAQKGIEF